MKLLEGISLFLEKIYNTLKYNWLYILLSVLFPVLFYKFDAGKEILLFLDNPKENYNISLIAFSFSLLSLSIWIVPVFAIDFFQFATKKRINKYKIFLKIDNNYDGYEGATINKNNDNTITPQLPVKYIALLPWIIFLSTVYLVFLDKIYTFINLAFCILIFIFLDFFLKKRRSFIEKNFKITEKRKWIFLYGSIAFFVFYISLFNFILFGDATRGIFTWVINLITNKKTSNTGIFSFLLLLYYYLGFIFTYLFIILFDCIKRNKENSSELNFNYKASKLIHTGVVISVLLLIFIFYFFNRNAALGKFSPIFVAVIISCLLILAIDFFVSSQRLIIKIIDDNDEKLKRYKFIILGCSIIILSFYFLASFNDSYIRTEKNLNNTQAVYNQQKLEDYFEKWYDERVNNKTFKKDTINDVYLISGQGGGSRAGAWFLMNMLWLDGKNTDIYNQTFSISTVSGSSSGANMYLAFHQLNKNINDGIDDKDTEVLDRIKMFTKNIYNKNYFNGGIFGLLINDFTFDAFTNLIYKENKDRNYTLQREELKAFENSYFSVFPTNIKSESNPVKIKKITDDSLATIKKIRTYFEGDFLNVYNENQKASTYPTPLFFLNSTVVNDGTKGIFSPVKLNNFSLYRDLYSNYKNNKKKGENILPMVACVNQSQAFPLINAYNYLPGVGRLGDGGFYENSGTETTFDIYKALEKYCQKRNKEGKKINVNFVFINLINSKLEQTNFYEFNKASYLNTIDVLVKSPFSGHEYISYEKLKNETTDKSFISITPENAYSLTRMLSNKTIESMFNEMQNPKYIPFINSLVTKQKNNILTKEILITENKLFKNKTIESNISETSKIQNNRLESKLKKLKSEENKSATIFIQYSGDQAEATLIAKKLGTDLNNKIQPIEHIENIKFKSDIRYFNLEDSSIAENIRKTIALDPKYKGIEARFYGKEFPFVPKQQFEVWISN